MEKQQQPEALILANDRPSSTGEDLYQWALDAEAMIRRQHARNQELEAFVKEINQYGVLLRAGGPAPHDLKDRSAVLEQYVKFNPRILEMDQQPEAIKTASKIELAITCGFIGSAAQYQHLLLSAVSHLRRLHARVEELEAVAADHIAQDRKMVAAPAELNLDDYYCKGCGRIGEIEELNAQDKEKLRKIEGKPKTVAAPVEVVIDFERVGSAGPFEVVEGRVAIPVVTMLDLARMLKPTTDTLSAAQVVLPEPDAWAAVHFSGKRAGKIYTTCDTKEQIEAYIHQVHQSNDSITLRAEPIYMRAAAHRITQEKQG